MNTTKQQFKDHSRFTRWANSMDEKDKHLDTHARKGKWMLIVAGLFVLYAGSFFISPKVNIQSKSIQPPQLSLQQDSATGKTPIVFDQPIDSFENRLNRIGK